MSADPESEQQVAGDEKVAPKKPGKLRRVLLWVRVLLLFLLLLSIGAGVYLNQIGLPGFAKDILLARLESQGVVLKFDRIRLQWYQGIVAENVQLTMIHNTNAPAFELERVVVGLDGAALRQRRIEVTGLNLKDGLVHVPFVDQPGLARSGVTISNIQANLMLLPSDLWMLSPLKGECAGATVQLTAAITNAPAVQHWKRKEKEEREPSHVWQLYVDRTFDVIEQLQTAEPPALYIDVAGDAADTNKLSASILLDANDVRTPWGEARRLHFSLPLKPESSSEGVFRGSLLLELEGLQTEWGKASRVALESTVEHALSEKMPRVVETKLTFENAASGQITLGAGGVEIRSERQGDGDDQWQSRIELDTFGFHMPDVVDSQQAQVVVVAEHSLKEFHPDRASLSAEFGKASTPWGSLDSVAMKFDAFKDAQPEEAIRLPDTWRPFIGYEMKGSVELAGIQSEWIQSNDLTVSLEWDSPELRILPIRASLYEGGIDLKVGVDVSTWEARVNGSVDFDILKLSPLFGPKTQAWLSRYEFEEPPNILVRGARAVLPPPEKWKGNKEVWREEVLPTFQLNAHIKAGKGAYQGVSFEKAESDLFYTNRLWHLPNLTVDRPEGRAIIDHASHEVSKQYYFKLQSDIDLSVIDPFLKEGTAKVMDEIKFSTPPLLSGTIWGQWGAPELTGLDVTTTITNIHARGFDWDGLHARVLYTNQLLSVLKPEIYHDGGKVNGEAVHIQTKAGGRITFQNMTSTVSPRSVTMAIGPQTYAAIEPYQYLKPPKVWVTGSLPLRGVATTDMHFQVLEGGPFKWWKFDMPSLIGGVHWVSNGLTLSNMVGKLYEGDLTGDAHFKFKKGQSAQMQFSAITTNSDFGLIMTNLFDSTNAMSGTFSGTLNVTNALAGDMNTWDGDGTVLLEDGFIWDIPLFGGLSKVTEAVLPGLGSPRVSQGDATFTMTNGVIHTEDMILRARNLRLRYDGTVDFDGNLDARMEGEFFRDRGAIPQAVGFLMTPFTKMAEFKITGNLAKPVKNPVYLPKLFRETLNPFVFFNKVFKGGKDEEESKPEKDAPEEDEEKSK